MDDPVRLSEQHFRTIYERGFYTWAELHGTAINNPGLSFLDLRDIFPKQPCFPQQLRLKKVTNENRVYASGYSTWGSSVIRCEHGTPSFRQQVQVEVAAKTVITLTTKTLSADFTQEWFPGNRNYIAVLALAWTYVLSARWAEMFPGICSLTYCRESVCEDLNEQSTVVVDIGDASADEAQWWASILTQGQGWCATMTFGHETFVSPWSIRLESNHKFVLSTKAPSAVPPFPPAPSFSSANRFLTRFCLRHGIADQSRAALAAVLLFPGIGRGRTLQLPVSPGSDQKMSTQTSSHPNFNYNSYQLVRDSDLDRLLTLSCFTRGLRPMLLSVFYEPSIECNAVSAWLQGSLAAIHERARHAPLVLGRMLMDRSPKISFLWLGVTVLGLQEDFLAEVRRGHIPIDLHSAAWSGTTQTFLQLPTSNCHDGYVTRADECRLLFLSQSDRHTRLPLVQWKPFGSTLLEDTDLEVRNHARCDSHKLYYQGFEWDVHKVGPFGSTPLEDTDLEVRNHARCDSHKLYYQVFEWEVHKVGLFFLIHTLLRHSFSLLSRLLIKIQRTARLVSPPWCRPHKDAVSYDEMDLQREVISENATRNIFTWLRPDGCARHENEIWDHEWFGDWESEDEFEESGQSDRAKHDALSRVDAWLKSFAKE